MAQPAESQHSPAAQTAAPPVPMSYEKFLAWAGDMARVEWVQGEVCFMSPASNLHQNLADFLTALLRHWVEAREAGEVRSAPFQMKLERSGREPDVLFVAREHLDRLRESFLDGPADLVVEIISPESRGRDRGEKFYEYEQSGVREYWLLDPLRRQAEMYGVGEDGIYRPLPVGEDGLLRSAVLEGLWLRLDWLWQDPLPKLLAVLREWGLV
jgi:Uma2 family endonuclease